MTDNIGRNVTDMIPSYALFFSTAGTINAYSGKHGQLKNSMFWFGNNLFCFKVIIEFWEFWNKIPWCRALILSCLKHPRYADLISRQAHCFRDCGSPLHCECLLLVIRITASGEQCTLLLVLLILLQYYTLSGKAPNLCM